MLTIKTQLPKLSYLSIEPQHRHTYSSYHLYIENKTDYCHTFDNRSFWWNDLSRLVKDFNLFSIPKSQHFLWVS